MRILIMGGTQFIGRHIVDVLKANGDEVTLFHRGKTNASLFPELEHRIGDRNSDLSALADGEWDATIDPSAYVPRQVRELAHVLGPRGGRYVHISSGAVYANLTSPKVTEDSSYQALDDPTIEIVNDATYGGLKYLCELATHSSFGRDGEGWSGEDPSIVRPTYVAGPFDHTRRFTWWVQRIARGGKVLAPEPRQNPFQVIDVRDVAKFTVRLAYGEARGTFHVAGPMPPFSFEDFLNTVVREVGPAGTQLVWMSARTILDAGIDRFELPLWEALTENPFSHSLDPSRAIAAGLEIRPLGETIRDVLAHETRFPTPARGEARLSESRERELLG